MSQSLRLKVNNSPVVLIIDSLELRRAGVVSFLTPWANDAKITIVQIDGHEAIEQLDALPIKMILLIIGACGVSNTELKNLIALLHDRHSDTPIVLISEREEPEEVVAAFKAGARGFIPMNLTPLIAMQAFTFIMSGGSFFPAAALMHRTLTASSSVVTTAEAAGDSSKSSLTSRQQDVLVRLRQGESNKLIGRHLKLRESTVKVHIRQIMKKLGATNRTQAALCAAQLDLSEFDQDQLYKSDQDNTQGSSGKRRASVS
jgi:DNA-binding NarL/FixJ family response regulator